MITERPKARKWSHSKPKRTTPVFYILLKQKTWCSEQYQPQPQPNFALQFEGNCHQPLPGYFSKRERYSPEVTVAGLADEVFIEIWGYEEGTKHASQCGDYLCSASLANSGKGGS